jgi:hypothetical protein
MKRIETEAKQKGVSLTLLELFALLKLKRD